MLSFLQFLAEGGAGGHVLHPFDIANSGEELIDIFKEAVVDLKTGQAGKPGSGWVKLDGVNISVRVVNNQFVLDRGSAKELDVKGMRPKDFEARGLQPGLVEKAKKLFKILDASFDSTKPQLNKLGVLNNPNMIINIEFVEGQTNVIKYDVDKFIAIHGLRKSNYNPDTGKRTISDVAYNVDSLNQYVKALAPTAKKFGFSTFGNPSVKPKVTVNLEDPLAQKIQLNGKTKTLKDWLLGIKQIPHSNGRAVIFTKNQYVEVENGNKKGLSNDQIRDYIIYKATITMGDAVLKAHTSDLGDLEGQEGLMMKRKSGEVYKITGSFILKGMESSFRKD